MAGIDKYPIIFLDRDGTIIVDKVYLNNPDEVEFIDGVIDGLKKLYDNGYKLVIVTNQSGVSRGKVSLDNLEKIHEKIKSILNAHGVSLFKIFYCPHLPEDNCECRKPKIGMVKEIENIINKEKSFVIGDKDSDIGFGKNLGIKTILLLPNEKNNESGTTEKPDFVVSSFYSAVEIVLHEYEKCNDGKDL
ncbi:MAG: HAD family hydrolase [Endomicrobia bacterium]|nr:HAD family hydrolase [Endomicrobiia bacterium]MDW8056162.1 HAD family hydrolase [Elusimicrobiota bacterium]